jgi:hypothetical protein
MAGNDLFIKWSTANPNDIGDRPINPCGGTNPVWDNQSIWLTQPGNPSMTLTKAKVGQQIQVNVRVTNKATGGTFTPDPTNALFVKVQIWICNYAVAVGPNGGIASAGGSAGQEGLITNSIASGGTAATSVLWTPQAGDLNINTTAAGEGHVCVGANVYWEGTTPVAESHQFPPPGVLSICGDGPDPKNLGGHHGQKNILIASAMSGGTMIIPLNIFNLLGERDEFLIEVIEAHTGKIAFRMAEREVLLAEKWVTLAGGKPNIKPKIVHGHPIEPIERAQLRAGGKLVLSKGKRPIALSRRPIREFQIVAKEQTGKRIKVVVNPRKPERIELSWQQPEENPGAVHVFDVLQRARGGRLLGGARVVAVTR